MPDKELKRLQTVHRFLNFKIDKNDEMQGIVQLAAELCGSAIAVLVFADADMQQFAAGIGGTLCMSSEARLFAGYVNEHNEVLVIADAITDKRFPALSGINQPSIRFYAGASLRTHDGHILGSLCIMDEQPKMLTERQIHSLDLLATKAVQLLELDLSLHIMREQFLKAKGSEIMLRSFFESSGTCHALLGKAMELLVFNKNLADFILSAHEVKLYTGMHVSEILQQGPLDDFVRDYNIALEGQSVKFEREVNYNGRIVNWYVNFDPAYNDEGEIIGVSYNCTDITEHKAAQQQIIAKSESLTQMAYIQSHDMRKPVASILGFMELFKNNNYQATTEELQMMDKAVREMDNMIRRVVAIAEKISLIWLLVIVAA